MNAPNLDIENGYDGIVAGIDEAGRGPWAGHVMAAAVIMDKNTLVTGINDSKKLTKAKREAMFEWIMQNTQYGIGMASVEEIDVQEAPDA